MTNPVMTCKRTLLTAHAHLYTKYWSNHIFIHIPKTGGSSVDEALKYPFQHKTAREKRREIGHRRWSEVFSFSIVRNPWDRLVSFYAFERSVRESILYENPVGFSEWASTLFKDGDFSVYEEGKYRRYLANQHDWLYDETGNLLVNHVMRFENLQEDFRRVAQRLGKGHVALPHNNKSQREDYRAYYTAETKPLVADFYGKDIETFGYTF